VRSRTLSVVFGIGYGLGLGLFFGLASGIATGITLSIEFSRAARGLDHYSLPWEGLFSAIRGLLSELDCAGFWVSDSPSHLHRGVPLLWLTRNPEKDSCPEEHRDEGSILFGVRRLAAALLQATIRSA
jgi:hypothetical protein